MEPKTRITTKELRPWTRAGVLLAVVSLTLFGAVDALATDDAPGSLAQRHRVEFRMGYWDSGYRQSVSRDTPATESSQVENLVGAFSYSYWAQEQLATHVTMRVLVAEATSSARFSYVSDEYYVVVTSATFGARFYPTTYLSPLRPYVTVGVGPYIGIEDSKECDTRMVKTTEVLGTFGGHVGVGFDIQMGRHFMLGVNAGYNLMVDFQEPLGGEKNFNGVEFGAGISLLI
jgi:outer membrane protein W